jgi:hypothetical protein
VDISSARQELTVGNVLNDRLAGYAEAAPLAGDHRELIRRSAIMSGLRPLSL